MSRKSGRNPSIMLHNFYCINCGNKGIDLMRKQGHKYAKGHRKKLYCVYCRTEVNHVECISYDDIERFKEDFADGKYREEAEESISFVRGSGFGKVYMGA